MAGVFGGVSFLGLPEEAAKLLGDLAAFVGHVYVSLRHVDLGPSHDVHNGSLGDSEHEQDGCRRAVRRVAGPRSRQHQLGVPSIRRSRSVDRWAFRSVGEHT